jgi:hypothetical protein
LILTSPTITIFRLRTGHRQPRRREAHQLDELAEILRDRRRAGPLWCFGASLARLLPVIEINKEFTEFFNDPERERLNWWQSIVFSALGIVGFVPGAILIAAVSGLTQGS